MFRGLGLSSSSSRIWLRVSGGERMKSVCATAACVAKLLRIWKFASVRLKNKSTMETISYPVHSAYWGYDMPQRGHKYTS